LDLLADIEFLSGENLFSNAVRSGRQMNFHHFHGVHPSRTTGMVERKMGAFRRGKSNFKWFGANVRRISQGICGER
jgi:hypothetical protein